MGIDRGIDKKIVIKGFTGCSRNNVPISICHKTVQSKTISLS